MSIQSEITRISNNVASAYSAVEEQGGTLPEAQNSDNLAPAILSIPRSSGSSVAVDGMTIIETEGVISTAVGGGKKVYDEPILIMPSTEGKITSYGSAESYLTVSSFDKVTLASKPSARLTLRYMDKSGNYQEYTDISYTIIDDSIPNYPTFRFDYGAAPTGLNYTVDHFEYNSNNSLFIVYCKDAVYANNNCYDMTLSIVSEKEYINNDFIDYSPVYENVEGRGYQTAEQVQTAITTALSAIGVAEEGAY